MKLPVELSDTTALYLKYIAFMSLYPAGFHTLNIANLINSK